MWQRGTSFTGTNTYSSDRWKIDYDGTGTRTVSQQTFAPGTAPVSGYESTYFFRWNQAATTGQTYAAFAQRIEDVRVYAGQTVTLSFWAKADATRTVTPHVGQNFGTGGSSYVDTSGTTISLTTSWTRYTQTFAVPNISGKTIGTSSYLEVYFNFALNTAQIVDFWGMQLEAGSTATGFQTATGTVQGELDACQRYYWRAIAGSSYQPFASGFATSSSCLLYTSDAADE